MKEVINWLADNLSECIAGAALLFSIWTQIKQRKSEKKLNDLKREFFETQSQYNKAALEKEQSVSVRVSVRALPRGNKELVFENTSLVNADNFNVVLDSEFIATFLSVPVLPTTLFSGESITFKYALTDTDPDVTNIVMSWENSKTGKSQSETRVLSL